MDTELIYWRHRTPVGIKVEEVSGAPDLKGRLWTEMALQVYCEYGKQGYRELEHYPNGAPYLADEPARISITHTTGLLAVATLPPTPAINLEAFDPRTAMGIDAEKEDRAQTIKLRERFLSDEELALVPADDVAANVLAWTIKEAVYKAAFIPGLDFRRDLRIVSLPRIDFEVYGQAWFLAPDGSRVDMNLYSYRSEGCIVTIAWSPECITFKNLGNKQDLPASENE